MCSVDEDCYPWTSSSWENDTRAITFELSNDGGPGWHVSDATLNSFFNVAADAMNRWGMADMVVGSNLTWHQMFSATACPGPYLLGKMGEIAQELNRRRHGGGGTVPSTPSPSAPPVAPSSIDEAACAVIRGDYGNGSERYAKLAAAGFDAQAVQNRVNELLGYRGAPSAPTPAPQPPQQVISDVVAAVLRGEYGNGADRAARLIAAGYDYNYVQSLVNAALGYGGASPSPAPAPAGKSISQLADEVIRGEWGNGEDRRNRLSAAGYDYQQVQNEVNRRY